VKPITLGERIKLRNDILRHVERREWIFGGVEKGSILLQHQEERRALKVGPYDIDWEAYQKAKNETFAPTSTPDED
jgi:hypothetical protein